MTNTITDMDSVWLAETVRMATDNVSAGGGPFGALIAGSGGIVATGVNRVSADADPTAHAEVTAIRAACAELGTFALTGCVLVSSCEPCPMCLASALWARVDRIVYAADRHTASDAGFDDLAFYRLFDAPRDSWQMPISQVVAVDGQRPFTAWLNREDRVEY